MKHDHQSYLWAADCYSERPQCSATSWASAHPTGSRCGPELVTPPSGISACGKCAYRATEILATSGARFSTVAGGYLRESTSKLERTVLSHHVREELNIKHFSASLISIFSSGSLVHSRADNGQLLIHCQHIFHDIPRDSGYYKLQSVCQASDNYCLPSCDHQHVRLDCCQHIWCFYGRLSATRQADWTRTWHVGNNGQMDATTRVHVLVLVVYFRSVLRNFLVYRRWVRFIIVGFFFF